MFFLLWLVTCAVIDFKYRKCFNWIVIFGGLLATISLFAYPELHPVSINKTDSIFGGFFLFIVFLIFYYLKIMGAGDVKYGAVLGLWVGWDLVLPIWVLSCFFAVIHGFFSRGLFKYFFETNASMKDGNTGRNRKFIPYVTYLSLAAIIVMGFYKNQ